MSDFPVPTVIFIVGGAFSTALCSYIYHALIHFSEYSKLEVTRLNEQIESLLQKSCSLEHQITYLNNKIESLEEKQYESDILLKSHTELDKELKEYVHCNFDVI
uniref:Uncharacterized protein n=1 Tax=viral metagenome TaxID=1070528 RepID=A0A6C0E0L6_9ZZZZ